MKTNFRRIGMFFFLFFMITKTVSAQEVIYVDEFSNKSNWKPSFGGGSASFLYNKMKLEANVSEMVGQHSNLPANSFLSDSVEVQIEFNSTKLAFQILLGTKPNRIQITRNGTDNLRVSGEQNTVKYGAKFINVPVNTWHLLKVKYNKINRTATFVVDDGIGNKTQTIDLKLQIPEFDFLLNSIDIRAFDGEVLEVRNLKIIGVRNS